MRDEMVSKPLGWPGGLARLFANVGFLDVIEEQLGAIFEYQSFEDYWSTFLTGQGKTGSYVANLKGPNGAQLRRHVRAAYLCGMTDSPRALRPRSGLSAAKFDPSEGRLNDV